MRLYWCVVIVALVTWQASGQAPGDHDSGCRMGLNANGHASFPPDWETLMDTADYNTLFENSPQRWLSRNFDADGEEWEQFGGFCSVQLRSCSFSSPTRQENWLFTQFISYQDANEIIFNITFRFTECRDGANCNNDYVTLYRYDTNGIVSNSLRSNRANYMPLFGSVLESRLQQPPPPTTAVNMNYRLVRPAADETTGFYLGIEDDGTCGTVERIIVYYRVVRGRTQDLLTCPDVALPPQGSSSTSQKPCVCHANASPTSATLNRECDINSVCNEDQACACSPGFELNTGMCRACPEGEFKAGISNSTCRDCPANSESRGEGNAVCPCVPPNIRDPERPGDPCTTPPSSPRLLLTGDGVPQVDQSSISVCWLPALDKGGLDDLHYNIYLYDTTDTDPVFKVNDAGVFQEEGGNNQTRICYELQDIDTETSYGIIVVAANGATGDPAMLMDTDQVQGRSVVFFLTLGDDLVPVGGNSCNVAVAVVVTLLITMIATAAGTTVLVIVIIKFCFNKNPPTFSKQPDGVKYQHQSADLDTKSQPGPARKPPPPRPPMAHKPVHT